MKCPYCGHNEDRVLDTREQKEGEVIRRRRECIQCKSRFSTVESLNVVFPYIVKKDGRREPFSKEKLLKGLQAACQKRPISLTQLEAVVDRISAWGLHRGDKEIPSRMLGQKLMMELRLLDDTAYVRFASVYRNFKDVQEFVETLEDQETFDVSDPQTQLALAPEKTLTSPLTPTTPQTSLPISTPEEHASPKPRTRPADPIPN